MKIAKQDFPYVAIITLLSVAAESLGASFTPGNIVLSSSGTYYNPPKLFEYSRDGQFIQSIDLPAQHDAPLDVAIDSFGNAHVAGRRRLKVYDPLTGTGIEYYFPGYGNPTAPRGGVTTFRNYTFLSSSLRGLVDFQSGLLRAVPATGESEFFGPNDDAMDVTIGGDGVVYGLYNYFNYSKVRGYDPVSLTLLTETQLDDNYSTIAVDSQGAIYTGALGEVQKFTLNGELIASLTVSDSYYRIQDIDLGPEGNELVFSGVRGTQGVFGFANSEVSSAWGIRYAIVADNSLHVAYVPATIPEPAGCIGLAIGSLLVLLAGRIRFFF